MELLESLLILVALFSLLPLLVGFKPLWYQLWLGVVLVMMIWVSARRLRRTREAVAEARRKRDREERGAGPTRRQ
jgi:membrane protein required for beta-lactamase induction